MMFMYGCEAPWLNTRSNTTCESNLDIKTLESSEIDQIRFFFHKFHLHDFLPDCLNCSTVASLSSIKVSNSETLFILIIRKFC